MPEMRFVQRDGDGKIVGHYACAQPYAQEVMPEDHPDLVRWCAERESRRAEAIKQSPFTRLEQRVAELERIVERLNKVD